MGRKKERRRKTRPLRYGRWRGERSRTSLRVTNHQSQRKKIARKGVGRRQKGKIPITRMDQKKRNSYQSDWKGGVEGGSGLGGGPELQGGGAVRKEEVRCKKRASRQTKRTRKILPEKRKNRGGGRNAEAAGATLVHRRGGRGS